MTNKERAIIMAYTGVCMLNGGEFQHFHKYVEELLGRPVYTHELADEAVCDEIKEKAKPDFLKLCAEARKPLTIYNEVTFSRDSVKDAEGMSELIYKAVGELEYKFELEGIIALLRKLLLVVYDYNIGYRTLMGAQVGGALEFLIKAVEAKLKKEEGGKNADDNA